MISDGINTLIAIGLNDDVLASEIALYEEYKDMPMDEVLAYVESGRTVDEKCELLFDFLTRQVGYKLDKIGDQYIKTPARLLADRCGDCKSLTMFINCALHQLGIPHIFRFVNFDGGCQYTHVYPVAIDEYGREIILDACEKDNSDGLIWYNYARPFVKKKDFRYER